MTTLVIDELRNTVLRQEVTNISGTRSIIKAVRLNLYGHNNPNGSLRLKITNENFDEVINKELGIATIQAAVLDKTGENTYWHGIVNFEFDSPIPVEAGRKFNIELEGFDGYNFSEDSYIGWIKPHESFINSGEHDEINPLNNPFGFELWKFKLKDVY